MPVQRQPATVMTFALAVALWSTGVLSSASAASLVVGPGEPFATIAAAIAASHDGDVVNVLTGTYVNDFAEIRTKITLRGLGSVKLQATQDIANGKAILITDTDVTITGIAFHGARVSNANGANGAGIRYQGGNLILSGCFFASNQEGLLGAADPNGSITILNSEFGWNGAPSGPSSGYTHNLYVGKIAKLHIDGSYFHNAYVGHEIKSRAATTLISNTRVVDGPTGTASYSIDLPNGGAATILDDQIEQGPHSENPAIISFGEEGGVYGGSSLAVTGSIINNDLSSGSARAVVNATSVTASVTGNTIYGLASSQVVQGRGAVSGNNFVASEPTISTAHPWAK